MSASSRIHSLSLGRLASIALGASCLWLAHAPAAAADKASLQCIQSAEEGQTARGSGDLVRARELFTRCAARDCPSVLRRDCATWLDDNERQVPSVVVGARDGRGRDVLEATASVDGVRVQDRLSGTPIDLNPGPHVIRVEGAGAPAVELRVVARAGEKNRPVLATLGVPVVLPTLAPPIASAAPASPPPPRSDARGIPLGAFVLGGVAVVATGAFAYFGLRGNHDADVLHATCAPGCTPARVDPVRREFLAADIALGVGVVSLGAATWVAVRGLTRPQQTAWEIVVAPASGGAQAGATVRF